MSDASLLQRGFSACPRNGRDASAEVSACEMSRGGLVDSPLYLQHPTPAMRACERQSPPAPAAAAEGGG